jgi:BirA family transcriptional regulator, biotin operon repressor / biotin---[acetyl-CoA-carboxylase] ligase
VPESPFLSRQARFPSVESTNDVVRAWLAEGTPEVCLAVADEQTAGRGRSGRSWVAPPGAALLLSLGFRPTWLEPERVWRLSATVSLAMADAAEEVAGLPDGSIRLKWPNDLVVELDPSTAVDPGLGAVDTPTTPMSDGPGAAHHPALLEAMRHAGPVAAKLAGVLGESQGLGTDDPRVVVGIGLNAGWPPEDFPPALATRMTSLHEASRGRPIDLPLLLDGFLSRLEVRVAALRAGRFDLADWNDRQLTTGREVEIEWPDGTVEVARCLGVDASGGGLVIGARDGDGDGERTIFVGEIRHVRVAPPSDAAPRARAATASARV